MSNNVSNHPYKGIPSTVTGSTVATYAVASTLRSLAYHEKLIIIKNTDAVNGLTYTINGYAYAGGIVDEILAPTVLAATEINSLVILDGYAEVVISVIDTSAGDQCYFQNRLRDELSLYRVEK